jgi:hypothetical protein
MNLDDLLKSIKEEDDDSKGGKINGEKFLKRKTFENPLKGQRYNAPSIPGDVKPLIKPVIVNISLDKIIPKNDDAIEKLIPNDDDVSKEILEKLDELIDVIKKDNELEKKEQDYDRKKDAKVKRETREKRIESKKLFANSGVVKKSVKKIQDIFDTILRFLGFTLLGQIIKFVADFLGDPKNKGFIENTQEFIRSIPGRLKEAREKIQGVIDWFKGTIEDVKKFTADFRELLKNAPFLGDLFKTAEEKEAEQRRREERDRQIEEDLGPDFTAMKGGGMIPFLGTDTVPAMLTPGEFVMSRGAVNMFGADTMMAMNKAGGGTNRPKFGLVSGYQGGGIVIMSDMQRKALDVLAKYESKGSGDYNAVNQYGDDEGRGNKYKFPDGSTTFAGDYRNAPFNPSKKPLTSLTVREVLSLQSDDGSLSMRQWADQGKLHAVGKYQIIGNTLPGLVERAMVPLSAKFDEKAQDIIALQLMKERGITPWVGPSDKALPPERAIVEAARKDPIPTYVKPVQKKVTPSDAPPVIPSYSVGESMGPGFDSNDRAQAVRMDLIDLMNANRKKDNRFSGFDLDFIFKPIRELLGVDTPNAPTSTKIIVLPSIKQTAQEQQPKTQTGNEIPDFKISSGVKMRGLVGKALGIEDLVS